MASLTIRNIPEDAKLRLRQIAAAHGRSMEEHLRQMVIEADAAFGGVRDISRPFRHFEAAAPDPKAESRARIERLMELGRGIDWEPEPRDVEEFRGHDWFK
jgi:plasmid stability protein